MLEKIIAFDFMAGSYDNDEAYNIGCKAIHRVIEELDCKLILTALSDRVDDLESEFAHLIKTERIKIYPSTYVIDHGTKPELAFDERNNNTTTDAVRLLLEGRFGANAVVSSGNTGLYAYSILQLEIPCIGDIRFFPLVAKVPAKIHTKYEILPYGADLGASPVANDRDLVKYAILLDSLLQMKKKHYSKIGILTMGVEDGKGTVADKRAKTNLEEWGKINFVGNIEPNHIKEHEVDAFVCDGKTGNIFLKTVEAYTPFILELAPIRKPVEWFVGINPIARRLIDKSNYDGAIFLGYEFPIIKAHGNSDENELFYAVRTAVEYIEIANALNNAREKIKDFNRFLKSR